MEVGSFLRATLRRWWLVLLVVIVAGAGAFLFVRTTKDTYDGTVVLTVPAAQASTTGSNSQYVENFQTALTTSDVVKAVSKDTKVSEGDLTDGLTASQVNNSSYIDVDYNGTTAAQAEAVVVSAAKRTSAYLARSVTNSAIKAHDAAVAGNKTAQARLTSAQNAMNAFTSKHGPGDPGDALQSAQASINQITNSRLQAVANDKSTKAFDTAIAAARAQVKTLTPLVSQYNSLAQALRQAQSAAADAQSKLNSTAQALAVASAPALLDTPTATTVKARSVIVKTVAIAAGVGLVFGVGLAMLLAAVRRDNRRGRRRRSRSTSTESEAGEDAAGEDAAGEASDDDSPAVEDAPQVTEPRVGGHRARPYRDPDSDFEKV